ncbi:tubulin polyglutamylase TTLL5-like isoform X10 [Littorina saxatilis]|uniref:tubulin polyglutamylase TTLL5-like isoform X10 n=1 Tax=Littorina saxatilis TaxID=31220 RepID=UPI0038B5C351
MASRVNDSDGGGSLTPSEQSDGEERSEHDSDYETDDGEEEEDDSRFRKKRQRTRDKNLNIIWTGFAKKTPTVLFNAGSVLQKHLNFKTVGERYHLAFKFGSTECKIIRNILAAHGFHEVHPNSQDYNIVWTNSHLKPFTLRTMTEFQKINHFPRSYELTRKDRLYKNIQRMQQIKGAKHFDFVPQSFVLPGEYQEFCSQFLKDRGPWIVKPVASSRGRGVFLCNHPDQVPLDENLIVSHYLHNPLVIDGFKFDVRLYVAVTSYDPLVIYLYEEGLTRFATVKYERSTKHIRNQCMHLTNYSVNKRSNDYVKNDDPDVEDYGNKWSMGAMLRYLRSMGRDTAALMMRIEDVVIKTLLSVELSIATACKMFMPYRSNCFELYGFDILVDNDLKPWVLEVNLSPSLACDSPLDLKIKGNMLCDLFSLAGIVAHDPMMRSQQQQNRRNTELASKLAGRAKSAFTRPVSARPKARPLSATAKPGSAQGSKTGMAGLNSDEIKIVRRTKEEEQRKGGWIRVFPSADTWDVYGPFLQFNTTHNLMLHQRLYPERHKMSGTKSPASSLSSASRSRTGYLQVTGTSHTRLDAERTIESYTLAMVRARQYERKLGSRSRRKKKGLLRKGSRPRLAQGLADDEEEGENQSGEEDEGDGRGKQDDSHPKPSSSSTSATNQEAAAAAANPQDTAEVKVLEVKVEAPHPLPLPVPTPPPEPKYDVVDRLVKGGTLTKVQARSAFAMYLVRVQQRLISESGPLLQDDVDALNEQMDLVLRFLKRAAVNLQQTFRVVVPSRKLSLGDRRRILAKQLGDFVHIYNKETDQLKQQVKAEKQIRVLRDSDEKLDDRKFDFFVTTAAEGELEEVLTTYTKLNKSASIFLGSNSTAAVSPTKPAHNPVPAPSMQRAEMLHRRREASEGDSKGMGENDPQRKLFTALDSDEAVKVASRPSSAYGPKPTPFSTSEPVVDTYNEEAIREALQRLATRQQARQYSAINSSSALKPGEGSRPSSSGSHRRGSFSRQEERPDVTVHPGNIKRSDSRPSSSSGVRYISKEEYMANQVRRIHAGKPPVTGVPPNNYHTASVNSRQFQLALQQARNSTASDTTVEAIQSNTQHRQQQQRLLEQQSRTMMEASKAKHHAMVAQAHAAQRSSQTLGDNFNGHLSIVDVEAPVIGFAPKPPIKPAPPRSKPTGAHRLTRVSPAEDQSLNFNFYNSLQYDIHTGQMRRKAEGNQAR